MADGNVFDYTRVRSPDMKEVMKNIDTAFSVAHAETLTTSYTVLTTDLGKTIRVNAAGNLTMTLPAVGATEDGAKLTFVKQGAGKMTILASTGDKVGGSAATGFYASETDNAVLGLEYVHGATTWAIVSKEGTFAST